jgi:hypothetical protein
MCLPRNARAESNKGGKRRLLIRTIDAKYGKSKAVRQLDWSAPPNVGDVVVGKGYRVDWHDPLPVCAAILLGGAKRSIRAWRLIKSSSP